MAIMLGKRQSFDGDMDNDSSWGYSNVSIERHQGSQRMAKDSADRNSNQMGHRWRYPHTTRTMACLGAHACATKDQARPASDGIPQSMSLRIFQ